MTGPPVRGHPEVPASTDRRVQSSSYAAKNSVPLHLQSAAASETRCRDGSPLRGCGGPISAGSVVMRSVQHTDTDPCLASRPWQRGIFKVSLAELTARTERVRWVTGCMQTEYAVGWRRAESRSGCVGLGDHEVRTKERPSLPSRSDMTWPNKSAGPSCR